MIYFANSVVPPTPCPNATFYPPDIKAVHTIWSPIKGFVGLENNYSVLGYGQVFDSYYPPTNQDVEIIEAEGKPAFYWLEYTNTTPINFPIELNETIWELNASKINYTRRVYSITTSEEVVGKRYVANTTYCYLGYCNYFKSSFEDLTGYGNTYNITSLAAVGYGGDSYPVQRTISCGLTLPIKNRPQLSIVPNGEYIMEVEDPRFIANYSDYNGTFGKSFTTLAYVLTDAQSAGFPNYGVVVEVQNELGINRYLITSGLEAQEGFYTDFNLRHYLDCNIYDNDTENVIPLFFSLDGGYVWVDVASACTNKFGAGGSSGGATYNESQVESVIGGILCGDNELIKIDNYTIQANINSNNSILFWWKYLNGSTGQIATTGVVNYTVGNSTNPVVQGKLFCDGKLINVLSMDVSDDFIRSDPGVVFVLMFIVFGGLMFLTRSITLNVAVTVFIILAFWLLKFIKLDVAFIMGMTIVGLAIIALVKWGEKQ